MARQRDRLFVFWSVHGDPFPEATTPLSRFGRYLLASVLFVIQLTFLVGVPATPSLLAWSTQNQLWPALIESGLEKEAREVLGYLILDTILLVFMIWGCCAGLCGDQNEWKSRKDAHVCGVWRDSDGVCLRLDSYDVLDLDLVTAF
ncbi:hypothetical protein NW765_017196 [Fusarium oxysporum]|nr:hypothetical protein NW765_017196 [Fusarium oxysporum]